MKTCFKCNRQLPPDEFYKHPMMADGRLGKCKDCAKRDVRENRHRRHAYYLEYDRQRSQTPERLQAIRESQRRYPHKHRARILFHNAVARGKIVRPKECERCGATGRIEDHHEDYAKPLEVNWLCRKCHALADAALRERTVAA
jgi:ribosomal protein S27AE